MTDAGEERGHAVVVVLRPALERMVVALGALHANAEEELGGRFRQILRIACDAVKISRRVGERASPGNQQIADDLVEWDISFDLLAQPILVDVRPLLLDSLAAATQHVGPFQRPEVRIFRAFQQAVDQSGALVAIGAVQEFPGFRNRRNDAAQVEVYPAGELLVAAQLRWRNAEHPQLFEGKMIDVIVLRGVDPPEAFLRLQIGEPNRHHLLEIAAQNCDLAALAEFNKAVG